MKCQILPWAIQHVSDYDGNYDQDITSCKTWHWVIYTKWKFIAYSFSLDSVKIWLTTTTYRQVSNIRRVTSQNLDVSCLVLQLSSRNLLKPGVKSRMKM